VNVPDAPQCAQVVQSSVGDTEGSIQNLVSYPQDAAETVVSVDINYRSTSPTNGLVQTENCYQRDSRHSNGRLKIFGQTTAIPVEFAFAIVVEFTLMT
jgi:hypothetical protein